MMDTPPPTELVTIEIQDSGCHIILDREEKFNALNTQMITELCTLFDWTAERSVGVRGELTDSAGTSFLRTLVLSGAGRHFCAGADINMMRDAGANSAEENRIDSERLDRLFNGLWAHPCFTIGAIQGVALGGGAGLVACLDHVIATSNVKIALSEGKLGILPAVIGPYVYRRLGSACFRRLAMQASRIDAEEALRTGFIEAVVGHIHTYIHTHVYIHTYIQVVPIPLFKFKII
jgi:methylglutaconyl-CoA hydratase